jgi:hypothetical protein
MLTPEEIGKASRYLADTRSTLIASTEGLSPEQWSFKPAHDRWSVAEIVEHLVLIEERVRGRIANMGAAPEPPPDWHPSQVEAVILREVPSRAPGKTAQAPAVANPTGGWSRAEALEKFLSNREQTISQLSSAPSLRGHVAPHPLFGPWDGYHWLVAVGAHTLRHVGQIQEVKSDVNFPQVSCATSC